MSAVPNPAQRRPVPARPEQDASPRVALRVVNSPHAGHGRVAYLLTCLSVIVAALIAVLVLNTAMNQGAFQASALQQKLGSLNVSQQAMAEQLSAENSPANLAAKAATLGMVPAPNAAYLSLKNGQILGTPMAAK